MQQIKIGDTLINVVSCYGAYRNMLGSKRNSIEIVLESDYETVVNTFVDGITYSLVETTSEEVVSRVPLVDENGDVMTDAEGNVMTGLKEETVSQTYEYDKSNYCLSGDVVDHRNGTISVFMGEKTSEEELLIALYGGAE